MNMQADRDKDNSNSDGLDTLVFVFDPELVSPVAQREVVASMMDLCDEVSQRNNRERVEIDSVSELTIDRDSLLFDTRVTKFDRPIDGLASVIGELRSVEIAGRDDEIMVIRSEGRRVGSSAVRLAKFIFAAATTTFSITNGCFSYTAFMAGKPYLATIFGGISAGLLAIGIYGLPRFYQIMGRD